MKLRNYDSYNVVKVRITFSISAVAVFVPIYRVPSSRNDKLNRHVVHSETFENTLMPNESLLMSSMFQVRYGEQTSAQPKKEKQCSWSGNVLKELLFVFWSFLIKHWAQYLL